MTPEQRETWKEHQERLYAMAVDDGETWDLSANDQAACNAGGDAIMALLDRAALRAPAVTGEADSVTAFVERCEEIRNGSPNQFYAHVDKFCKSWRAAAPPAAVAPPDLVAFRKKWRDEADREALALLGKLANEVSAMLGVAEQAMRESAGHTNVAVLIQRRDEARALLARCEGDAR